ncbi:putative Late nodulin [Medicago truncatula]|uniref:Putative Late nodulin n=1 Tax=Medicago truncatula TaxID=3880 RepID=A0A396HDA4_MEDTR|nr:putative Late nodulin [Medicago truncatula]
MTTILKFAYIMIICLFLFLLHVAAQKDLKVFTCQRDEDCKVACATYGGDPWCFRNVCFCKHYNEGGTLHAELH